MARQSVKAILNLDDRDMKRRFIGWIGTLAGAYEVDVKPRRDTRSLRQNAWYWSCIVAPLADFLAAQDYELCSIGDAHEILKAKFLTDPVVNPATGEVVASRTRSTTDLTTAEFANYCDRARAWLWDFFGIHTNDPEPDVERRGRERVEGPAASAA